MLEFVKFIDKAFCIIITGYELFVLNALASIVILEKLVPMIFICPLLHSVISKSQFEINAFITFVACMIAPDIINETFLINKLVTSI